MSEALVSRSLNLPAGGTKLHVQVLAGKALNDGPKRFMASYANADLTICPRCCAESSSPFCIYALVCKTGRYGGSDTALAPRHQGNCATARRPLERPLMKPGRRSSRRLWLMKETLPIVPYAQSPHWHGKLKPAMAKM